MDLRELQVYTKRIEDRYHDLLTYREGIQTQIKIEEENLKAIHEDLIESREELDKLLLDKKRELEEVKRQVRDGAKVFLDDIHTRDEQLKLKSKQLYGQERSLQVKEEKLDNKIENYEKAEQELREERQECRQREDELAFKILAVDKRNIQLETIAKELADSNKQTFKFQTNLDKEKQKLDSLIKENLLKQQQISKDKEFIRIDRNVLNTDRLRLQSQQIALKLAIDEAKKKGVW